MLIQASTLMAKLESTTHCPKWVAISSGLASNSLKMRYYQCQNQSPTLQLIERLL